MAEAHDQQFIEYVVTNIVDHPEEVKLERTVDDRGVLLTLSVHPDDMGKIIGKAGGTAKAIRTLLRVLGAKDDERYNLKIVDADGSGPAAPSQDEPAQEDSEGVEQPEAAAEADDDVEAIKKKAREGLDDLDMDL